MRHFRFVVVVLALAVMVFAAGMSWAGKVSVACAANFTGPMKELAALYEARTGVAVETSFGSTGMLFGQITQGAPFELFFAADTVRPAKLHSQGLCAEPCTYALGRVVLWSSAPELAGADDWLAAVSHPAVVKLALAKPETAPYGAAARDAMVQAGLADATKGLLVYGKNVGQAFQFAFSGSAEAAFVALSQALSGKGSRGRHWPVPEAESIVQNGCLLAGASHEAVGFFEFVLTDEQARDVIARYGYE